MGVRIWGVEITVGDILIDITGAAVTASFVTAGVQTGTPAWYAAALAASGATLLTLIKRQKQRWRARRPRVRVHMFQHQATTATPEMSSHHRPSPWATGEHDSVLRVRKGMSRTMQHKGTRVVATYEEQIAVRVFHPRDPKVHALTIPPQPNDTYARLEMATGTRVLFRVAGVSANAVFLHLVFQRTDDS